MEVQNKQYLNKDLKEIKNKYPEIPKELFPDFTHKKLSYNLINSCTSFANAIRRCCLNELEIKYLNIQEINTNDKYQINQVIENRINQIPLLQSIEDNVTFKLSVKNDTSDLMHIYTNAFKVEKGKNQIYFNQNIKVCSLRTNCYINIVLNVKQDKGCNDGKYSLCCTEYEILDADYTTSSVNQNNKEFYMGIETFGNIEPSEVIKNCCDLLVNRLKVIEKNINEDKVKIIVNGKINQYLIENESHTISNLLCEYTYNLNPEIELVNTEYITVPDNKFYLCIIDNNHKKLILNSINAIIIDLNLFKSKF
jgi:hypothetical protein